MPIAVSTTKAVTDRMPKVISPGLHAILDYVTAASFFAMAAGMWRRNRPAAISALICGGSEALVAAMTDYPGGIRRKLSFEAHGRIDAGMALLVAGVPGMMNFADEPEAKFFSSHAVAMAAVTGLTDFTRTGETRQLKTIQKAA